jgi:hypothetical protein
MAKSENGALAKNVRRLSRLDLPGMGQVIVQGDHVYVGHMDPPYGTSIVDVSDPRNPKLLSQIEHSDQYSHSHKVRVIQNGTLMIVNIEQYDWWTLRKGNEIPTVTEKLKATFGRDPSDAEVADELQVKVSQLPMLKAAAARGYADGGFKIYDIRDKTNPKLVVHHKTGGVGVHRFCADDRYAYISTQMEGFHGNILVIYDLSEPARPQEVSRWWLPGQNVAAGEKPDWIGYRHRLHHALRFGDRMYAACWYAGLRIVDISNLERPVTIGSYGYHPATPAPTHTVMPVPHPITGKRLGLVVDEEQVHFHGQPHAGLWVFDFTDERDVKPLSQFHVSDRDTPWSHCWFGAHQYGEQMTDNLVYVAWLAGGLRIVDISDPYFPDEVGVFIPEPGEGQPNPVSNDVALGPNGLIYLSDRLNGLDILEYTGTGSDHRKRPRMATV